MDKVYISISNKILVLDQRIIQIHRSIEKMPKIEKFLTSKRRAAMNTSHGYKTSLAYFQQFLTTDYDDATLETIIERLISKRIDVYDLLDHFVNYLQANNLSRSTIHQYLVGVRSYLLFYDVDIVTSKFKHRVTIPKCVQEEEQALDQDDIRKILNVCNNRRLKTYILVLASSGLRAIEACAIRLCDLDFESKPTRLHVRGEYTKTKVSRDIFISDEATRFLKDLIGYRFKVNVDQMGAKITGPMSQHLVFQVRKNKVYSNNLTPMYQKLLVQFHSVLRTAGLGDKKESSKRGRITFHSLRRFVKTTISNSEAGSDYSEWFLGHQKNSYYVNKPSVRAEIYATKVMKYLTFLDYSTLQATGRTMEAKIKELEKENQLMGQKHEKEMKAVHEQMDRIMELIEYNPKLARAKKSALERLSNTR
jgi:integrase